MEHKKSISITSKFEESIIVTQINIENKTVHVTDSERFIFNGDIENFKRQVAEDEKGPLGLVYTDMLSLAEEVIDVLSRA